jgi:mRNA-degrading endonuclease toxin of MazEF toxin-antitoxin module
LSEVVVFLGVSALLFAASAAAMMVAMMLPSLVPILWRYRQAVGRTGETRLGRLAPWVYATAVAEFLAKHQHAKVTERLDQVYGQQPSRLERPLRRAQGRSLPLDRVVIARGEVWWADLDGPAGSEPAYRRLVLVPKAASGLPRDSVASASQLVTLDRDFLTERTGKLPARLLAAIDAGRPGPWMGRR